MLHRLRKSPFATVTFAVLLMLLVAGLVACGSSSTTTTSAPSTTTAPTSTTAAASDTTAASTETTAAIAQALTVSAASSLKGAFTEIGAAFDAANNCKTTFNFDASGTLEKQIEAGAPVDVFASAAKKQVTALTDKSLADAASVKTFASNEIVLIVPANSTLTISKFEDLANPPSRPTESRLRRSSTNWASSPPSNPRSSTPPTCPRRSPTSRVVKWTRASCSRPRPRARATR